MAVYGEQSAVVLSLCVCVRERERERECSQAFRPALFVTESEKQRELLQKQGERKEDKEE